jgi:hypothetical protein
MTDDLGHVELVEKLCDAIVDTYDEKTLRDLVWDHVFDELVTLDTEDLMLYAEDFDVYTGDLDL